MSVLPVGFGSATNGGDGFQIERSLRFNSADSAYLNRTLGTSNRKTFTFSAWVKRSLFASNQCLFGNINFAGGGSTNQQFFLGFNGSDQLDLLHYNNGTSNGLTSSAVYRDPSAFYHVVCAIDTTQATSSNRLKLYVNGSQITAFASSSYPTQNTDTFINANLATAIGTQVGTGIGNSYYFGGYLTETYFIDGQALTPSDFGETDSATGVWKPKAYSGTYGTNGFYLKFADNSNTTAGTLGKDSSGNGNNWTPNNFSVTAGAGNDSLVDTPTQYGTDTGAGGEVRGNYCTWNPLDNGGISLSNGNLGVSNGAAHEAVRATFKFPSTGKWYCEAVVSSFDNASTVFAFGAAWSTASTPPGWNGSSVIYLGVNNTNRVINVNGGDANTTSATTANAVLQVAYDADSQKLWLGFNNSWYDSSYGLTGDPSTGANATRTSVTDIFPIGNFYNSTGNANFGQRPFAYTAPSGFKALCTQNLPTPTIGATSTTQANDYFNVLTYTGTGSSNAQTGVGFQPDLVWIKGRSGATDHGWYDAVRGVQKQLESNTTTAETTETTGLTAFGSDGFTVGALAQLNTNTATYVAWNWKANGAGSSNTAGTITSTVSANTTAGFSIVTWTGSASASSQTVGHGLGVAPSMVILKNRSVVDNWFVYHSGATANNQYLNINTTSGVTTAGSNTWGAGMTSTLVGLRPATFCATSSDNVVMYCFAPVAGYSAFGSYTGNGSADGPFVYTGFRPRFLLWKNSSSTSVWVILDTARNTYNESKSVLLPNNSDAEGVAGSGIDILSNGFKLKVAGDANWNQNGNTYIYAAFAESPFKYSLAR